MFGLPPETLEKIIHCFRLYPNVSWVKIYGSRAKGNFRPGSDIDLAYAGPESIAPALLTTLDELPTPYQFDLVPYDTLTHAALKDHIDRVGQQIYPTIQST